MKKPKSAKYVPAPSTLTGLLLKFQRSNRYPDYNAWRSDTKKAARHDAIEKKILALEKAVSAIPQVVKLERQIKMLRSQASRIRNSAKDVGRENRIAAEKLINRIKLYGVTPAILKASRELLGITK